MTTQPTWDSVDNYTADLLQLVANDQMHPRADEEWRLFVAAIHDVAEANAANDFRIPPNTLRELLRGNVAPRRVGAFINRAKAEGLIEDTGEWEISNDTQGRNAGRPVRVYRLT